MINPVCPWNSSRKLVESRQTVPLFHRVKVSSAGRWIPHPWYDNGPASGAKRRGWMVFDDLGKPCNNRLCFHVCSGWALHILAPAHTSFPGLLASSTDSWTDSTYVGSDACPVTLFWLGYSCHFRQLIDRNPNIPSQRPMATSTSENTNQIHVSNRVAE